jgi:hypothetical protein
MKAMAQLSDEELVELFGRQLPDLLERRPDLEPVIYNVFLKVLVRKEEVAAVLAELREFRAEVDRRFEQVDKRFDTLESRMEAGFRELHQAIDRLGAR